MINGLKFLNSNILDKMQLWPFITKDTFMLLVDMMDLEMLILLKDLTLTTKTMVYLFFFNCLGWELFDLKTTEKDVDVVDIRKNRMGVITLDFDRMLIFGGERNNKEYKDAYIYEFYENKFYQFSELVRTSNFIMSPVYYNGKYIIFDFLNNIHELNLETLQFEYHVFHKDGDNVNL